MFELVKYFNGSVLIVALLCLIYAATECYKLNTRLSELNSEIFRNPSDKRKSFPYAPTAITIIAIVFIVFALVIPMKLN